MTDEAVLIAAFSARALAASARRAGFLPLAVDCFGDLDTSEHAAASRCLPARVQTGFIAKFLLAALEALVAEAPRAPIGLVLGSGFECNPRLVATLAERFRLIGNTPAVIEHAKSPGKFFSTLDRLGIRHPETSLAPPPDTGGWLMKRVGGSGGLHIVNCPQKPRPDPRRYFQRRMDGQEISVMGIVSKRGNAFAMSRQWTSPLPKRPYRYGGAVGSLELDADLEARLIDMSLALSRELNLVGLVSYDFLVSDGEPTLLEVNPRPGATLDVFDDGSGSLFQAHVEACLGGGDPAAVLKSGWRPAAARAAAFLYADRGPITAPAIDWPPWAADRPRPGSPILQHQPLATVLAEATELHVAEDTCRNRLGLLENMLYEGAKAKGAP